MERNIKIQYKKVKDGYYIWYSTGFFTRKYIEFTYHSRLMFFHNVPYLNKYDNEIPAETVIKVIERYVELNGTLAESGYNNLIAWDAYADCVPAIKEQTQKEAIDYKKTKDLYALLDVKFITGQRDARTKIELCISTAKAVAQDKRLQYVNDRLFYLGIFCQNQTELQKLLNE